MPYTRGFANRSLLADHFQRHGAEFGAATMEEYEALADSFCGGPMDAHTKECVRTRDMATLRYNTASHDYGVLRNDNHIRTYFKLTQINNLAYFQSDCAKT